MIDAKADKARRFIKCLAFRSEGLIFAKHAAVHQNATTRKERAARNEQTTHVVFFIHSWILLHTHGEIVFDTRGHTGHEL